MTPARKAFEDRIERLRPFVESGMSINKMADMEGVSRNTLRKVMKRSDLMAIYEAHPRRFINGGDGG